jgi:hypothetical protein
MRKLLFEHAHHVGFFHDQQVFAVDFHFRAGPFAEQHNIALLEVDWRQLAMVIAAAWAYGDDFALHGLLLCGVRNDDATLGLGVFFNPLHDYTVVQRTKFHVVSS